MGRPSPRTQGIDEEGLPFQKFGTQQLKFIDPAKPALGVTQVDTGKQFKGFTTSGYTGTKTTVFSERIQAGITGAVPVELHDEAVQRQKEKLEEMGLPQLPDLGDLFGGGNGKEKCHLDDNKPFCAITQAVGGEVCECPDWITGKVTDPTAGGRGCECEACKNGTGQCDADVPECDAWDLLCTGTGGASKGIVGGTDVWLWVKIILVLIGIGIFLWLLRPLFGVAKNITET